MKVQAGVSDQRESFRCLIPESRREAELQLGSATLPVRLLDESAGGFAVRIDRPPEIEVGNPARLRTDAGYFEVRVTDVTAMEPGACEASAADDAAGTWYRLGLVRLHELDPPLGADVSRGGRGLRFCLARLFPASSPMVVCGLVFAWLVVIGALLVIVVWHNSDHPLVEPVARLKINVPQPRASSRRARERSHPVQETHPAESPGGNAARDVSPSVDGGFEELRRTIRYLPGTQPFNLPAVVEKLELTADQQRQMNRLAEETSQVLDEINARLRGAPRGRVFALRAQVLDAARRKAIELLGDEQRTRWEELVETENGAPSEM